MLCDHRELGCSMNNSVQATINLVLGKRYLKQLGIISSTVCLGAQIARALSLEFKKSNQVTQIAAT